MLFTCDVFVGDSISFNGISSKIEVRGEGVTREDFIPVVEDCLYMGFPV